MKSVFRFFTATVLLCIVPLCAKAQERPPVFEETFEDVMSGVPQEWNTDGAAGDARWGYYRGGVDGSACLAYESYGYTDGDFNMLASPVIKVGAGQMVEFDYNCATQSECAVYLSYDGGVTFGKEPLSGNLPATVGWTHTEYLLPKGGDIVLGFLAKGDATAESLKIYIDNVKIKAARMCAMPVRLSVAKVGANSVDVSWEYSNVGDISETVEYEIHGNGMLVRHESVKAGYLQVYTFDGLKPNTPYSLRLRTDCNAAYKGGSEWSEAVEFTTACGAVELPVEYDFDKLTVVPDCWTAMLGGEKSHISLSSVTRYGGGGKSLQVDGGRKDLFVFSEAVDHAADDLEVSFYIYNSNNGDISIEVGLQTDVLQNSTYDKQMEVVVKPHEWTLVAVTTENTIKGTATGAMATVWFKSDFTEPVYIDNFAVTAIPECPRPRNIVIESFDHESATVVWDNRGETGIEVYDVSGGKEVLLQTLTKENNVLKGLKPQSDYTLRFKSVCGDGKSEWSPEIVPVHTLCDIVREFPFEEGFESGYIPECWEMIESSYGVKWETNAQKKASGDYAVMLNCANKQSAYLILPQMEIPADKPYQVEFFMYRDNATSHMPDRISIYANDKPTVENATLLGRVNRLTSLEPRVEADGWYKYSFNIPMSGNVYVIFDGEAQSSSNGVFIDDIVVSEVPECPRPQEIKINELEATSCKIDWGKRGNESKWEVTYEYEGIEPVKKVVETPFCIVENLTPDTKYDFHISVSTVCSETRHSDTLSAQIAIETPCHVKELENGMFTESFSADGWSCWTVLERDRFNTSNHVYPQVMDGKLALRGTNCMFVMPELDIDNIKEYRVVFDYKLGEKSLLPDRYPIEVGIMTDMYDPATFTPVDTVIGNFEEKTYTVQLDRYDGTGEIIAFRFGGETYSMNINTLDNVEVGKRPTCEDIFNGTVKLTTNSTATFILPGTGGRTIEAEYGLEGFALGAGLKATLERDADTVTVKGLNGSSAYEIYFRALCDDSNIGSWSDPIKFGTKCDPIEAVYGAPIMDGFENNGNLGCWETKSSTRSQWSITNTGAYEGSYCAYMSGSLIGPLEADLYYPADLKKGVQYELTVYVKSDTYVELEAHLCSDYSGEDAQIVMSETLLQGTEYVKLRQYFTPVEDATFLKIRGFIRELMGQGFSIDNFSIKNAQCTSPENVLIEETTETTATMIVGKFGNSWNVKVSTEKIDPKTDNGNVFNRDGITEPSEKITGLTGNTVYYYYLQSICADSPSEWSDAETFKTMCGAQPLPYEQGFDNAETLDCWSLYEDGKATFNSTVKIDGAGSCELSTKSRVMYISPTLDGNLAGYMLNAYFYSSVDNLDVAIGVMAKPGDFESYINIANINIPTKNTWVDILTYFNIIAQDGYGDFADAKYICITYNSPDGKECRLHIDALKVISPADCPKPAAFRVRELGHDHVYVDWKSFKNTDFKIEVTEGSVITDTITIPAGSNNTTKIDYLHPNTAYTLKLWAECGDTGKSESESISFTTLCDIFTLPLKEDFDGLTTDREHLRPDCWLNIIKNSNSGSNNWNKNYNDPDRDGIYMQFMSSGNTKGNTSLLQTPKLDLTGIEDAFISFDFKSVDTCLSIVVSTDGANFSDTIAHDLGSPVWTSHTCNLKKYAGKEIHIGFAGIAKDKTQNANIRIDNVYIDELSGCAAPDAIAIKNVNATSVTISITDNISSAWEILYGIPGFALSDAVIVPVGQKEFTINGLSDGTAYEFYVRSVCGDKRSLLTEPVEFVTECLPHRLPYNEDFETLGNIEDLHCHDIIIGDGSVASGNNYVINGNKSFLFNISDWNTWGDRYLVLPLMTADDESSADIKNLFTAFYTKVDYNTLNFEVGLIHKDSIDEIAGRFIPVSRQQATTLPQRHEIYLDKNGMSGNDYRIAFRAIDIRDFKRVSFDDISVDVVPPFYKPRGVQFTELGDTSVVLSWIGSKEAESSEIMLNGDMENLISVSEKGTFTLTSLKPWTDYTINIRGVKGEGTDRKVTGWSDDLKIRTLHTPAELPLLCNFETDELETTEWTCVGDGILKWVVSDQDVNGVYNGSRALYIENQDDKSNSYSIVYEPASVFAYRGIKFEKDIPYTLSFVYHSQGSTRGQDYMQAYLVPADEFDTENIAVNNSWIDISGKLNGQSVWSQFRKEIQVDNSGQYNLVFHWLSIANYMGRFIAAAIDSIDIREVDCSDVRNLTVDQVEISTAKLTWTSDNRKGVKYEYAVIRADEEFNELETETTETSQDTEHAELAGLSAETSYLAYIRSVCPNGSYSGWTASKPFRTKCEPVTVNAETPFVDDFEDYEERLLGCWIVPSDTGWTSNSDLDEKVYRYSGQKNIILGAGKPSWLLHTFDLSAGAYELSLYTRQDKSGYNGTKLAVAIGAQNADHSKLETVAVHDIYSNEYMQVRSNLIITEDNVYTIGIKGEVGGETGYLSIDSLVIRAVDCAKPAMFMAKDITGTTADITWNGISVGYKVRIDGGAIHKDTIVKGNRLKLDFLTPSTRYDLKLSAQCGENESHQAHFSFCTLCNGATVTPYSEDFDTFGHMPSCWDNSEGSASEETERWQYFRDIDGNGMLRFDSHETDRGITNTLKSPAFTIDKAGLYLSLDYKNPQGGEMSVIISDDSSAKMDTIVSKAKNIAEWSTASVPLDKYTGNEIRLIISSVSNYSPSEQAYHYIDNISVTAIRETVGHNDTLCYGEPYNSNGFSVPAAAIRYGMNTFVRMEAANSGEPAVRHTANVFVPKTDYGITGYIETGKPYSGNGFENIMQPGSYVRTETSEVTGCDSVIHLNLIEEVLLVTIRDTICEGTGLNFCEKELTESGTYDCITPSAGGKDSTTRLILEVLPKEYHLYDTICQGDFREFDGEMRTTAGTYTFQGKNRLQCDSVVHFHLHVIDSLQTIDTTVCRGKEIIIEDRPYNEEGSFRIDLPRDKFGCTRAINLTITYTEPDTIPLNTHVCEGNPVVYVNGFAGIEVGGDTTINRTDKTAYGCDSVTVLTVKFVPTVHEYDTVSIKNNEQYPYDGRTLTTGGDYTSEGLTAGYNCDSVHHLHLIVTTGLDDVTHRRLIIAPNPIKPLETSFADIEWRTGSGEMTLEVLDLAGRVIRSVKVNGNPAPITGLTVEGIYIIRITESDGTVHTGRLIVK